MSRNYKNIRAWSEADNLAVLIYQATREFPNEEKFGLTSQLRRAAVSVATNIVEGSSRRSQKDYLHFLNMAYGSVREVEYLLDLSHRLGIVVSSSYQPLEQQTRKTVFTLRRLTNYMEEG